MRKPFWSLVMIICTAIVSLIMLAWTPADHPVEARIVSVHRENVHQVAAITGRLSYADETYLYAPSAGEVSQVLVHQEQRVGEGEALIRLALSQQEDVLSAFAAQTKTFEGIEKLPWATEQIDLAEASVIRAQNPCTVRQVLIAENTPVAAGTPVLRISSNQQEIVCAVAKADVGRIQPGMWAWISADNEALGFARVHSVGDLEVDQLTGIPFSNVKLRPEQHLALAEGAAVDAEIYLAGSDDVLALPLEAITPRDTVWWVSGGRCTEISAEIVMTDEMYAWVSLPEGLQVAIGEFENGQYVAETLE